jgi:REP element-mobilizing transposase RayT
MARQLRIEYPGAIYHVLSRGNGGQAVFLSDQDRHNFLLLLQEVTERYAIDIFAYVLMGNHYHLLLRTHAANLSRAMQWFGTTYSRRFNLRNRTSGHLFQGRFKTIIVEDDTYLTRLSCYIHRNPLRAGLVTRLVDYPWSSYPYYAYKKKVPGWLDIGMILSQIDAVDCYAAYRKMVQSYSDEKGRPWEDVKHGLVFGSQGFVSNLKKRFLNSQKDAELPQLNRLQQDMAPQKLAELAAVAFGVDLKMVCRVRRVSENDKHKRDMLIYYLYETGKLSNQYIASLLGTTYSNISRRVAILKAGIASAEDQKREYNSIKSQIKV